MLDGCISEDDLAKACQRLAQSAATIDDFEGITISFSNPNILIITRATGSSLSMEEGGQEESLDDLDEVLCLTCFASQLP